MKRRSYPFDVLPDGEPDVLPSALSTLPADADGPRVEDLFSIHPMPVSPPDPPAGWGAVHSHGCLRTWGCGFLRWALVVIVGNLLIHLYCQNGQWVDPVRPHTAPFFLVVGLAVVLIREPLLKLLYQALVPPVIALPSVVGGMMAVVAFLAGLPGLEGWIPVSRQGVAILGDLELLLLPLVTIGQMLMLARATDGRR